MLRTVCLAATLAFALAATEARAQAPPAITWPAEAFNPRPAENDLVLPLPCGGAIVFRRVDTPLAASPLADRQASLGHADPATDYQEFLRQAFLAGPFRDEGREGSQHFFLGKYEVTVDQFAAVMADTCPPALPTPQGRLPRANVTWLEAAIFAQRASAWLHRHARATLPASDGATGFLRLPTEEEWEFAARGGTAVTDADFAGRLPPMEGGLERHAWFQGARSAAGRARPVGQLAANPLGLHDMLGNVAEWALEPFRLNRVGRPHGLAGGQVVRGGGFRTPADDLRSSLRIEYAPVNPATSEPARADAIGLRVALGRVAIPAEAATEGLRRAFEEESRSREAAAEDPARLLQVLRNDLPEGPVRAGLARVEGSLLAERRARTDGESVAIRAQMEAAAHMARQVMAASARQVLNTDQAERLEVVSRNLRVTAEEQERLARAASGAVQQTLRRQAEDLATIRGQTEPAAQALRAAAGGTSQIARDLGDSYIRVVRALGAAFPARRLEEEAAVLAREAAGRTQPTWLPEAQAIALRHIRAAAAGQPPEREAAVREIQAEAGRLMGVPAAQPPAAQPPAAQPPAAQPPPRPPR